MRHRLGKRGREARHARAEARALASARKDIVVAVRRVKTAKELKEEADLRHTAAKEARAEESFREHYH